MPESVKSRAIAAALTVFASLASATLLLAVLAPSFPEALRYFFIAPLSSRYQIGNLLAAATPLLTAALGITVAFRARSFNLGGEGQIYSGGLVAVLIYLMVPGLHGIFGICLTLAGSFTVGAFIGSLSGLAKRRLSVDPLISTFLVSALVSALVDYLIGGPFQDPASNFRSTVHIGQNQAFGRVLSPSSLTSASFVALSATLIWAGISKYTRFGFELGISGSSGKFAKYAGIDGGKYESIALALSGGLHGLSGALVVLGAPRAAMMGYSSGMGWSAIAVALLAGNEPLGLIPAVLFYAYLESGAKNLSLGASVPSEIVLIVQSVIFLLVTANRLPGIFGRRK